MATSTTRRPWSDWARLVLNPPVSAEPSTGGGLVPVYERVADLHSSADGDVWLCSKGPDGWQQRRVPVSALQGQLHCLRRQWDTGHYISQCTMRAGSTTRRASEVAWLNAVWLDIDLDSEHLPPGYRAQWLPFGRRGLAARLSKAPTAVADLLVHHMLELGLPAPLVVGTGRGLHAKWVLDAPLRATRTELRRWRQAQSALCSAVASHNFGTPDHQRRWPVDAAASRPDPAQVLRLIGSWNPSAGDGRGAPCRILRAAARVDFDELLERLAPHMIPLEPAAATPATGAGADDDERARGLWARRLAFGQAVIQGRGGVRPGERNNAFWPLATAAAWGARDAGALHARLVALHQACFAGAGDWTLAEANSAAASVRRRFGEKLGRDQGLYLMRTETFLALLRTTESELQQHGHLLKARSDRPRPGAMDLPKLQGIPAQLFPDAVRARQQAGGHFTQAERNRALGRDGLQRHRALELAAQGETPARIARAIGVPRQTVHGWLHEHASRVVYLQAREGEAVVTAAETERLEEAEAEKRRSHWSSLDTMSQRGRNHE